MRLSVRLSVNGKQTCRQANSKGFSSFSLNSDSRVIFHQNYAINCCTADIGRS